MNPIKPTIKSEIIPLLIIIVAVISALYFYSVFPERVPMHWNFQGEVNGWGSRATAAFAVPAMLIGIYVLFLVLPKIDPRKEKYEQFAKAYNIFRNLILLFLLIIYFLASFNALGYNTQIGLVIPLLVGILFIVLGVYLPQIKSNWFVGIRTPWTLSSETVWEKTHRVGGKMFILAGLLIALSAFAPAVCKAYLFIFAIIILLVGTIGYSYIIYQREKKK